MSRCVICDKSDKGLSDYRPDGQFHETRFHEMAGDMYCTECFESIEDQIEDYSYTDEDSLELELDE